MLDYSGNTIQQMDDFILFIVENNSITVDKHF